MIDVPNCLPEHEAGCGFNDGFDIPVTAPLDRRNRSCDLKPASERLSYETLPA
jgi:hypothetical protein